MVRDNHWRLRVKLKQCELRSKVARADGMFLFFPLLAFDELRRQSER